MDKIGDLLDRSMAKRGLTGTAEGSHVCFLADKYSDTRFTAVSFSRGTLKLSVNSSIDAAEVQIDQDKIISKLNQKIGKDLIKKIRLIIEED